MPIEGDYLNEANEAEHVLAQKIYGALMRQYRANGNMYATRLPHVSLDRVTPTKENNHATIQLTMRNHPTRHASADPALQYVMGQLDGAGKALKHFRYKSDPEERTESGVELGFDSLQGMIETMDAVAPLDRKNPPPRGSHTSLDIPNQGRNQHSRPPLR